jgi:diguanylate cyclase (GGDEF)-like protein
LHEKRRQNAPLAERTHASLVVPIGIVVAIAFVGIVIAALSSARRADEVYAAQETQRLVGGIKSRADRLLHELGSAAAADKLDRIATNPDERWIADRVEGWQKTLFQRDRLVVVGHDDRLLYAGDRADLGLASLHADLGPVLGVLRGIDPHPSVAFYVLSQAGTPRQTTLLQTFDGRPALVAGIAMRPAASGAGPAIVAVHFIDSEILADIAERLQLHDLHLAPAHVRTGERVYGIASTDNRTIARFAWAPHKPGAEIVSSVFPFVAIAFSAFLLLAAFVLRHMGRTARTIASTERRLRHQATHDPLCGLPNRVYFSDRLESMIGEVRKGGSPAAVFYIDLDHFKDVNDILGHPVGDELIDAVANRLSGMMREGDVVARLGGDEFAVIRTVAPATDALHTFAQRIISTLCSPYALADQSIVIGASVGIALISSNTPAAADVMRHADLALYRAKNEGRNRACIYDAAMDADLMQRKLLEDDLRDAIAGDRLRLEYQPVVNASGEKVIGVEALARWVHPQHGEVSPGVFIPIAEHSGLIIDLGIWVLRRACLDGKSWPNLTVAVNVSPMQFRRADFVDVVERTLIETGFDPARLELEVTESTLIGNVDMAQAAMMRLKALGVKLALDDFGTGYSSLQYLRRFPFDRLKIDHSFVRSIETAANAAAIVHAVVSLGRGLGMKVTAEGVETAEQHLFLRAAGVHAMQGYRFGRAVVATQIADFSLANLEQQPKRQAAAG